MTRLRIIIAAIWNKMLGRAEDKHHREILDLSYDKLLDMLVEVKRDVADVTTAKHRIKQQADKTQQETETLEKAAFNFLEAGDDSRAQEALQRKALALQQLTSLRTQLDDVAVRQQELEASQAELETRIHQFKAEKEVIKAKFTAAEATARIGETVTGISREAMNVGRAVGRIRERTEELEARGDAVRELVANGTLDDMFNPGQTPLDRAALNMERQKQVEADMARLRKQLKAPSTS